MASRKIDLTFPIHEGMMTFPVAWHPRVEITRLGRLSVEKRETRRLVLGTHTGTHCDAPRHFIPNGKAVDQIKLDTLIGPSVLLNFSKAKKKQEIQISDLKLKLGSMRPERIILRFDWSKRWGRNDYYSDHPFISEDAARWLVSRGLKLLAMDTPMPDNPKNGRGSANDSPNHKIFLGSGVVLVEYLCNLKAIRKKSVQLIVLPLKIIGGDGSPVRCVAIES
ncbi:MAG: cyclase family protein [Candidatus Omnitrophota bacterium]